MALIRKFARAGLLALAVCGGILQACLHNPDPKGLDEIVPGLYQGAQADGFAIYFFKLDSIGTLEFRQYDLDSTIIGQSISNLSFRNDSAFFSGHRSRTYRYFDNSRTTGEWSEWKAREDTGRMYSDRYRLTRTSSKR